MVRAKRNKERPGHFFYGIPDRDLTDDEYDMLTEEQRYAVQNSGLWDVVSKSKSPKREESGPAVADKGEAQNGG